MHNYNLFNLITIQFEFGKYYRYKKYFDNEYLRIVKSMDKNSKHLRTSSGPKIIVKIVKSLPEEAPGDIRHVRSFKGLFTYRFAIRQLESDTVTIFFEDHPISKLYINAVGVYLQAQILEPIMYLKLLENNVIFLHAAGVSRNGKGYLMPAHGGTGKTTTCISLLSHGFKLLGDDLLLVDAEKKVVFPYQRPLHLFTYNIKSLQGAKMPIKYTFIIYFKNLLRFILEKIMRTDFLISTRVHADELYKHDLFSEPVKYGSVLFLTKTGSKAKTIKINSKNVNEISEKIIISADLNDSLYELVGSRLSHDVKKLEIEKTSKLLSHFREITFLNTRKTSFDKKSTIETYFTS